MMDVHQQLFSIVQQTFVFWDEILKSAGLAMAEIPIPIAILTNSTTSANQPVTTEHTYACCRVEGYRTPHFRNTVRCQQGLVDFCVSRIRSAAGNAKLYLFGNVGRPHKLTSFVSCFQPHRCCVYVVCLKCVGKKKHIVSGHKIATSGGFIKRDIIHLVVPLALLRKITIVKVVFFGWR